MKNFSITLITIGCLIVLLGTNYMSYKFGRKECHEILIRPDTVISINPEIDHILSDLSRLKIERDKAIKQRDSLINLIKKNETKVIYNDTCIPAILREWAEYQSNE
jgi:hypothetical protein